MNNNNNILKTMAYFSLIILSLFVFITQILPVVGLTVEGRLLNILMTIERVMTLLVLAILGLAFTKGKKKGWLITYFVALAIFIAGIILIWLK